MLEVADIAMKGTDTTFLNVIHPLAGNKWYVNTQIKQVQIVVSVNKYQTQGCDTE